MPVIQSDYINKYYTKATVCVLYTVQILSYGDSVYVNEQIVGGANCWVTRRRSQTMIDSLRWIWICDWWQLLEHEVWPARYEEPNNDWQLHIMVHLQYQKKHDFLLKLSLYTNRCLYVWTEYMKPSFSGLFCYTISTEHTIWLYCIFCGILFQTRWQIIASIGPLFFSLSSLS